MEDNPEMMFMSGIFLLLTLCIGGLLLSDRLSQNEEHQRGVACIEAGLQWVEGNCLRRD